MRYRRIMLVFMGLLVTATAAQTTTPVTATGSWALQPAPASSVEYRRGSPLMPSLRESPFRFSDNNEGGVLNELPPRPMDRAAVLGTDRAWLGGRPPLDCAMTPRDARCH
ncbi:MAG: hypothetical protein ACYC0F_12575 [Rhodanobacter sp.]